MAILNSAMILIHSLFPIIQNAAETGRIGVQGFRSSLLRIDSTSISRVPALPLINFETFDYKAASQSLEYWQRGTLLQTPVVLNLSRYGENFKVSNDKLHAPKSYGETSDLQ